MFPCPSMRPSVAAGGRSATATMTPTSTLDSPVVSDSAAAAQGKQPRLSKGTVADSAPDTAEVEILEEPGPDPFGD